MDRKIRFGIRLKALRKQRGLTQEQLAELIDRSVDAISKMERGITLPSLETLMRLNEKLHVSMKDLVDPIDDGRNMDHKWLEMETILVETVRSLDRSSLAMAIELLKILKLHQKD